MWIEKLYEHEISHNLIVYINKMVNYFYNLYTLNKQLSKKKLNKQHDSIQNPKRLEQQFKWSLELLNEETFTISNENLSYNRYIFVPLNIISWSLAQQQI